MTLAFYDAPAVAALLDLPGCIATMRDAMITLSADPRSQPLRQIFGVGDGGMFGVMPGALADRSGQPADFGAKLVSVFSEAAGRSRHQGLVVVFDPVNGAVRCIADAEAVTGIRTACATAAATDALARVDATRLGVFGTGLQAEAHVRALCLVRPFEQVMLWGRDYIKAQKVAASLSAELGRRVIAVADGQAAAQADILCTASGAAEPILLGAWIRPGAHVNLVGSSHLGPVEVDDALVVSSRYIVDYRPGALAQASEFAAARDAGLIDDDHIAAEIGDVFAGRAVGRRAADDITVYKSLGHVVQDLAAVRYLHDRGFGTQSH